MNFQKTLLGEVYSTSEFIFFFGNKDSNRDSLQKQFPEFNFLTVKQVHGNTIVESEVPSVQNFEADAHFTKKQNLALVSITADCVPILIFDSGQKIVAAVHAGWRGVANEILPKTISELQKLGSQPQDLRIAIGPHIQMPSFEVGKEVQAMILSTLNHVGSQHFIHLGPTKSKINLAAVLCSQLQQMSPQLRPEFMSTTDTFQSPDFHSFRRDSTAAGRQWSFAVMSSK